MTKFFEKNTKDSIKNTISNARKKRDNVFENLDLDEKEFKEQMTQIRSKVFDNFKENLKLAKSNFKKRGFIVHEVNKVADLNSVLKEVLGDSKKIAKSKTNTGREVDLGGALKGRDYFETDLGDFIVQMFKEEDQHYVLPAIHIDSEKIAEKIKEVYGEKIEADPTKLTHFLCNKIRERILSADVGITGANFITKGGQVVLLENEGNISLVSRLPQKHIVLVGIDKLVETVEDATKLCKTAAMFGTGQDITQYISIISGPSRTADIENKLVDGAQGAKEVHLILVDNYRLKMLESGFGDFLRCISCGSCINFCPVYHQKGNSFGGEKYIGAKGLVSGFFREDKKFLEQKGLYDCTLCGSCSYNCPMQIPLSNMIRRIRQAGKVETKENKQMLENVKRHGNPFGEVSENDTPDKLYCC